MNYSLQIQAARDNFLKDINTCAHCGLYINPRTLSVDIYSIGIRKDGYCMPATRVKHMICNKVIFNSVAGIKI